MRSDALFVLPGVPCVTVVFFADVLYLTSSAAAWLENDGSSDIISSTAHFITDQIVVRDRPQSIAVGDVTGDG
jgi:hypothetical protein